MKYDEALDEALKAVGEAFEENMRAYRAYDATLRRGEIGKTGNAYNDLLAMDNAYNDLLDSVKKENQAKSRLNEIIAFPDRIDNIDEAWHAAYLENTDRQAAVIKAEHARRVYPFEEAKAHVNTLFVTYRVEVTLVGTPGSDGPWEMNITLASEKDMHAAFQYYSRQPKMVKHLEMHVDPRFCFICESNPATHVSRSGKNVVCTRCANTQEELF